MVEQAFLDKLKAVLEALAESRGAVSMFVALKMDDLTDKWAIIVSAPWTESVGFEDIFNQVRDLLIRELDDQEMSTVARIGAYSLNSPFTRQVLERYKSDDEIKEDTQINGNLVHTGYIIHIDKDAHLLGRQGRIL